ncbi:MATE family efflux transporter [Vibrio sp. 10N.261.55.A7]|uniref:MATE family efflux transporter n=1 Tax=Vibrio sp. 10N.261.55.A7 TaxID=1880851 RepID=UPI000C843135|nr:MATE family efflux transporter [Vibrio sp. 10N.261.55.A7]PMJ90729.1 MATE family efflux transporter [Vibrio sp. 10N.261.55.A7]
MNHTTTVPNHSTSLPNNMLSTMAKLAFPVAIQSALVAVLSLADVLMVSDIGMEATAAVGVASKWLFVAIMIAAGVGSANGILVAQYWGRADKSSAKTVTLMALKYGAKLIIPATAIITLFSSSIMLLQTTDASVIELGSQYLWYALPVLLLTHIIIVLESSLRSSGDAMLPLLLAAVTIAINIALNYVLINGVSVTAEIGIPAMGVAGAALATSISRALQVGLFAVILYRRRHWLFSAQSLECGERLMRSFKSLAVPTMYNAVLWAMGTLSYQMIFGHMGTTELAVFSMIGPFELLCYSAFFGISTACSVLLGQSLGRDDFAQAIALTHFFIKFVLAVGVTVSMAIMLGKEQVIVWLNLDEPTLQALASPALSLFAMVIWLRMLNMVIINGILRAGGENQFCLRMDFISMWMIGVPLTAIGAFVFNLPFASVFALMLVEEVVKFALCFHRYMKRTWVNNLTISA